MRTKPKRYIVHLYSAGQLIHSLECDSYEHVEGLWSFREVSPTGRLVEVHYDYVATAGPLVMIEHT